MSSETLTLLGFAFMTALAYMIAINARGIWRLTLSFLLATCMLGGTVWVIILQYSATARAAVQADHQRLAAQVEQLQDQHLAYKEHMSNTARVSYLITQANGFAVMLQRERLQDPGYSHDALVARAADSDLRLEALQKEIDAYKNVLAAFPEADKLLTEAMADLKESCRLYRAYYFAENDDAEQATASNMRKRARSAAEKLANAEKTISIDDIN